MAERQVGWFLRRICRLVGGDPTAEQTDGQLLERFARQQDEAAFAALVQRHGGLVLSVCRRVLGNAHDAEDAFQATFFVLLRKAKSLDRQGTIANWLYTVAYHVALRARAGSARRSVQERQVCTMKPTAADAPGQELQPLLDEELNHLSAKYRAPLVVCYLEGKTNEEAAQLLGVSERSVIRRLARGRDLLRGRLERRGVALASGAWFSLLATQSTVSATLADATCRAAFQLAAGQAAQAAGVSTQAIALTEGVLKAMWITNLKAVAAILVVAVGLAGSGLLVHQALADKPPLVAQAALEPAAPEKAVRTTKDDLTPASFAKLHALVRPQEHEWRHLKVQWQTDVVAARKKAAAEDKPILICYTGGAGYNEPLGIC